MNLTENIFLIVASRDEFELEFSGRRFRAELGHFNFRAENEPTIPINKKKCKFFKLTNPPSFIIRSPVS